MVKNNLLLSQLIFKRARLHHLGDIKNILDNREIQKTMHFTPITWIQQAIEKHQIWILANKYDEAVAFIWARERKGITRIERLAVHPLFQRQGLGSHLVNKIANNGGIEAKAMLTSLPFWLSLGFSFVKKCSNPETCILRRIPSSNLERYLGK
jgi:N-acetylglutamate synthase-like GNAT family acetyltransferase